MFPSRARLAVVGDCLRLSNVMPIDWLTGRNPASIGCLRAGSLETHVNTGLEDRQAGNPRKQWAGGRGLWKRPFYAGFRAGVAADAVAGLRPQLRLQRD